MRPGWSRRADRAEVLLDTSDERDLAFRRNTTEYVVDLARESPRSAVAPKEQHLPGNSQAHLPREGDNSEKRRARVSPTVQTADGT